MSTVRVWRSLEDPQIPRAARRATRPGSVSVEPTQDSRLSRRDPGNVLLATACRRPRSRIHPSASRISGSAGNAATRRPRALIRAEEFANCERFGEVVVGSRVEPSHLVVLGSAGRQHQDMERRPRPAESATNLDSVEVRQHEIEQDEIKNLFGAEGTRLPNSHATTSCPAAESRSVRPSRRACSSSTMRTRMPQDSVSVGLGRQDPVKQGWKEEAVVIRRLFSSIMPIAIEFGDFFG